MPYQKVPALGGRAATAPNGRRIRVRERVMMVEDFMISSVFCCEVSGFCCEVALEKRNGQGGPRREENK